MFIALIAVIAMWFVPSEALPIRKRFLVHNRKFWYLARNRDAPATPLLFSSWFWFRNGLVQDQQPVALLVIIHSPSSVSERRGPIKRNSLDCRKAEVFTLLRHAFRPLTNSHYGVLYCHSAEHRLPSCCWVKFGLRRLIARLLELRLVLPHKST